MEENIKNIRQPRITGPILIVLFIVVLIIVLVLLKMVLK
jgi:t-SNARE complex subunit (syntaxin)